LIPVVYFIGNINIKEEGKIKFEGNFFKKDFKIS